MADDIVDAIDTALVEATLPTAQERADWILDTLDELAVRNELSRRYGWPRGLSKDEILDKLLALHDNAPVDGETQHG